MRICGRHTLTLAIIVCLSFVVFARESIGDLKQFDWLAGVWKRQGSKGPIYESWTKVSPRTFEGVSYRVSGADTTYLEFLRLEQFGEEIYYTPKVPENPYPVAFKLTLADASEFVFENPNHDFPQRIVYLPKSDSEFHARVEGPQDGKIVSFELVFKREAE